MENKIEDFFKEKRFNSFPDETKNIAIDFDGVIHKCSRGFYDGSIYDDPVEGVHESLQIISKRFNIIVFTAKAREDRPKLNGKTGKELVWEWLKKHNLDLFVSEVTAEKPRAVAYIDDKAIKFISWEQALKSTFEIHSESKEEKT